jgi:hypothetical protein
MVRKCLLLFLTAGLAAWLPAQGLIIDSNEVPSVQGTYGKFKQNSSPFTWPAFDSTRTHWDLTSYPGGQWSRVGLVNWTAGQSPAPDSMRADAPDPQVMEIDTLAKYKLPAIVIVYNNNAWGTWTQAAHEAYALPMHLFQENLRYDKVAEALGGHGEYVMRPADFRPALERAYQVAVREGRPSVINCQGKKEFWDRGKFPPGSLGKIEPGVMSYYH